MVKAYRPLDFEDALDIMRGMQAIPFAGGTDLMVSHKNWSGLLPRFERPVLFISHLEEIKKVEVTRDFITLGAACTLSSLLKNNKVPQALKTVIAHIASPSIRNRATIGGNICNASPAGDTLPILYALNASINLESKGNRRTVPIEEFVIGPGQIAIKKDELLSRISISREEFNIFFYKKIGTRAGYSCAKLSFTGFARTERGKVTDIRISFGAVAPTVVRSREIEENMKDKTGDKIERMLLEIMRSYGVLITPIDDQRSTGRYRRSIALKLLQYFLQKVLLQSIG